jgi:glutaminyl-tRNA synthetase
MRTGGFPDGSHVLRAKIDMSSPNMNMRDPVLYRIINAEHHRTGNKWSIYPMYDYAHPISDSIEGVTHSICTLEFEDHRPLYDWLLDSLEIYHPQQIEFARLNLNNTVMSKRLLRKLVEEGLVEGWDDPRMPTISGLRRRGFTPESIRDFCERIGVAKSNSVVDIGLLEHCIREDLNAKAPRVMAVLRPIKVIIDNYPEDKVEWLEAENNREQPEMGSRRLPFSREIFIEEEDFMENPSKKYFRLAPGKEVRLKHAYIIKCESVVKDESTGKITELHCTYDPNSRSGEDTSGKKVKGTIHWLSAPHALPAEVRLYDYLFLDDDDNNNEEEEGNESADNTFAKLNPKSLVKLTTSMVEPSLADAEKGSGYQFLRQGYFSIDTKDTSSDNIVFNRVVSLRDTWAKIDKAAK